MAQPCSLASACELAALSVSAHRDEGEPDPPLPAFLEPPAGQDTPAIVTKACVREIFDGYRRELQGVGKARDAERKRAPIIDNLIEFLGHDRADASRGRTWLAGKTGC